MPGARCDWAAADGGPMKGGAPRVVWLTVGADPRQVSARSAAERLSQLGRPAHLVWNPVSGEIVQLVPIVRAACSLGGPAQTGRAADATATVQPNASGQLAARAASVQTEGRLCVQVGVVGFASAPFTSGPLTRCEQIMEWLDSWDISRCWPAGSPGASGGAGAGCRSRRLWARGGHFGASQVPCCLAPGPGAIDVARLTGDHAGRGRDVPLAAADAPRAARPAPVGMMSAREDEPAGALARAG